MQEVGCFLLYWSEGHHTVTCNTIFVIIFLVIICNQYAKKAIKLTQEIRFGGN